MPMKPMTAAAPERVDPPTLYYRTAGVFLPGDRVRPGNWGRVVQLGGSSHNLFFREEFLEHVRVTEFPGLPSRLTCAFAFEDSAFALNWPRNFGDHVYPVVAEPGASTFRADMSLVDVPGPATYAATIERARLYWQGHIAEQNKVEVLVDGALVVTGEPLAKI
jgi:hypothetical protein